MVNIGRTPWLYFKLGAKKVWILFQSGTVSTIYVISPNFRSVDPNFWAKKGWILFQNGTASIIYVISPNFKSVDPNFGAKKGLDIIPISGYYSTLELYLYANKQTKKTRRHHYIFIYNHVAFFVCLFVFVCV